MADDKDDLDSTIIFNAKNGPTACPESAGKPARPLSRIDPALMEKLKKISPPDSGGGRHGLLNLGPSQKGLSTGGMVFLITLCLAGIAGFRLHTGQAPWPVAWEEALIGKKAAPAAQMARVMIDSSLVGYEVTVDGEKKPLFNNQFELAAGTKAVALTVSRAGYSSFTTQIMPTVGPTIVVKPQLRPIEAMGFLTYETVPAAKLTIFQEGNMIRELQTPMIGMKLPVGKYEAVLENSFIGLRRKQTISIEEWKTTSFRLAPQGSEATSTERLPDLLPVAASQ